MSTAPPTSADLLATQNFEVTKRKLTWDENMGLGETKNTKSQKMKQEMIVVEQRKVRLLRHIILT